MPTSGGARPRVLLVDDVEANLVALEAQLGQLDCEPVRARSGNEALRLLLKHEFAVVLLDVQMPEMDGFEVARLARGDVATRQVPIIFVTAMHETPENQLRGYGTGAVDLLFKPVNPDILRSKVSAFLELHLGRQRLAGEIAAHKRTLAELEAFVYSVSHDLRAPLRPLEEFSTIILEEHGTGLDGEARELLERIRAAARRMSGLIEDLLQLSKVRRARPRREPVDLSQLAESVGTQLQRAQPERKVELVIEPGLQVVGDPGLLLIALENLMGNAWKFTGQAPRARIELCRTQARGGEAFVLRDNGAGFDPIHVGKLFQPFQRLHAASAFPGTGIGLAIVHRVFEHHGGEIWAEGQPDQGAAFHFRLPRE
jgi:signal transduction histidine kinase